MPDILDWQRLDPTAAVRHAVQILRTGGLVAFPTETGYELAASALQTEAVARVRTLSAFPTEPVPLAVRGLAAARDWSPALSQLGQRLARRFWPGPLTLASSAGVADGLCSRLPTEVRPHVCPEGTISLRTPAHEAILNTLANLPEPLVLTPLPGAEGAVALQVGQIARTEGIDLILDDGPCHYSQPATVVAVDNNHWQVVRPGVVTEEMIQRQSVCLVIFVCTGNTCRSPLSEALFKKRLAERLGCAVAELPARGFLVISAGLAAMMGGGAAAEAVQVAGAYDADLSSHRSQPLTPELAAQADYLIAMTRAHVRALIEQNPRLGSRPRLLDPQGEDVPDPIGHPQAVYEECGKRIWNHLEALLAELAG